MRTLKKGFFGCSLRSSAVICMVGCMVFNIAVLFAPLLKGVRQLNFPFWVNACGCLYLAFPVVVLGYSLYRLHRDDFSMINVSVGVLSFDIVMMFIGTMGAIFMFGTNVFWDILWYIIYAGCRGYCILVMFSFAAEIQRSATANI